MKGIGDFFALPVVRLSCVILGVLIVLALVFHAGVSIGERRTFEHHSLPFPPHSFMPEGHGAVGTITSVSLPTFTLETRDGRSETVTVTASTSLQADDPALTSTSTRLAVGQTVVVVGEPDGDNNSTPQIEARLIRVLPVQPGTTSTSPTQK